MMRAPHLRLTIFASGIDRLVTQVFFDDEPLNQSDPVLNSIPDPRARARLLATRREEPDGEVVPGVIVYALEITLRGESETPFFDDWA